MPASVPGTSNSIKRILLVRTDRLGDVILTLPLLPHLRKCFPDAYVALLLRRYTGAIAEGNPYVDELLWYDDEQHLLPFRAMLQTIRKKRFDAVIVVYPTTRLAWLIFRAGIPFRIGTGYRYYSILFNRKVWEHRKDAKRHEVEYNLMLLKELNCKVEGKPEFFIDIPSHVESRVKSLLESSSKKVIDPMVIIHPGTGGSAREWPAADFGRLAGRFLANGVQVYITGARGEEQKVQEVLSATGGKAIPFVGRVDLKELAALIRSASLFVSNSTGPLHLAVAVGTPVVGLYPQHTAMSAKRWGPYSGRNRVLVPKKPVDCTDCLRKKDELCSCMASISVEEVYDAACSLLYESKEHANGAITHG
ncbi:MAG: glycosyltransferase family 9 protein [Ignavibacteria bacterium]|nr:glycosyltransferase family 9 protein [Ignavibacteria bacterium]